MCGDNAYRVEHQPRRPKGRKQSDKEERARNFSMERRRHLIYERTNPSGRKRKAGLCHARARRRMRDTERELPRDEE